MLAKTILLTMVVVLANVAMDSSDMKTIALFGGLAFCLAIPVVSKGVEDK